MHFCSFWKATPYSVDQNPWVKSKIYNKAQEDMAKPFPHLHPHTERYFKDMFLKKCTVYLIMMYEFFFHSYTTIPAILSTTQAPEKPVFQWQRHLFQHKSQKYVCLSQRRQSFQLHFFLSVGAVIFTYTFETCQNNICLFIYERKCKNHLINRRD